MERERFLSPPSSPPRSPRLGGIWHGVLLGALWAYPIVSTSAEFHEEHAAGNASSTRIIQFDRENRFLSVRLDGESFVSVMEEIAKIAEVQITIQGSGYGDLTADFDRLPLDQGLAKLLKGTNHIIATSEDTSLKTWIFPQAGGDTRQEAQRFELPQPVPGEPADFLAELFAENPKLQSTIEQLQLNHHQIAPHDPDGPKKGSLKSGLGVLETLIGAALPTQKNNAVEQ